MKEQNATKRTIEIVSKTKTFYTFILVLMIILLALTVSCKNAVDDTFNGNNKDPNDDDNGVIISPTPTIPPEDDFDVLLPERDSFDGETLYIAVYSEFLYRNILREYQSVNPGVKIEILSLEDYFRNASGQIQMDAFNNVKNQIAVQLMAGSAPVLIEGMFVDYLDPRVASYLADWFPIMYADPDFNENDWFMNVFNASAVNDRLYDFPTRFSYFNIAVNSKVQGLHDRVLGIESITLPELLELYDEFAENTSFLFDLSFDTSWVMHFNLDEFFDFESGFVDFNNDRFIQLISRYREITSTDSIFGQLIGHSVITPEDEQIRSETYLFTLTGPGTLQHFIDFKNGPLFLGHIPITNKQNELIVSPYSSFVLNAATTPMQQALAWDFIKFINNPDNNNRQDARPQPTNRKLFLHGAYFWAENAVNHFNQFGWEADEEVVVDNTVELWEFYGDMPMTKSANVPRIIWNAIYDILERFHNGLITAERAAADIQNTVELMLMEMDILR